MAEVGSVWASGTWSLTCWAAGTWADAVVIVPSAASRGKYAAEHAGALGDLTRSRGFAAEHAGALSDLTKAGA